MSKKITVIIILGIILLAPQKAIFAQTANTASTTTANQIQTIFFDQVVVIVKKITTIGSTIDIKNIHPMLWFNRASTWFETTTGTTFTSAFITIKNFIVWAIGIGIKIIHWLTSLLPPRQ